uniref:Uncharacterized protein n=1 Tax=Arundo donax TaxID=35708 RepID=A0A0A9D595_ARUDO
MSQFFIESLLKILCDLWYACWISRDIITEFPNPSIIWFPIRLQLVDLSDNLLVPFDRLTGARPQGGAEVAEVAAGRQYPP